MSIKFDSSDTQQCFYGSNEHQAAVCKPPNNDILDMPLIRNNPVPFQQVQRWVRPNVAFNSLYQFTTHSRHCSKPGAFYLLVSTYRVQKLYASETSKAHASDVNSIKIYRHRSKLFFMQFPKHVVETTKKAPRHYTIYITFKQSLNRNSNKYLASTVQTPIAYGLH